MPSVLLTLLGPAVLLLLERRLVDGGGIELFASSSLIPFR